MYKKLLLNFFAFSFFLLLINISVYAKGDKVPVTTKSDEARQEFEKGRDLFEKLQLRESLKHFENAFQKDNSFALAYFYHAQANPNAAGFFEDLASAVKYSDKISEGEKLLIMSLQNQADGKTKLQEENLVKLIELYPEDERAHTFLGQFYFALQEYDKAVEHLKKSTEIAPEYSAPYNMLGYSYKNMEKYSEGEKVFKKYTELIPNDPNPYDSFAELLMKSGKYNESIEQYRKALSIDPAFQASYIGISNNLNYLGKHNEARKELDKSYSIAKNDGERRLALFAKVVSYADQGRYDDALKEMDNEFAIAKKTNDQPNMSADVNAIANILFEAGKYDEAKSKYEESLKILLASDVSDKVKANAKRFSLYNNARILLKQGKLEDAKEGTKEFTKQANEVNNTFQIWLSHELNGLIALEEKNYKKAIDEFMKGNLQNPYTFYYVGLAYRESGDNKKAEQNFKTAMNFNALNNLNQSFVRNRVGKMI